MSTADDIKALAAHHRKDAEWRKNQCDNCERLRAELENARKLAADLLDDYETMPALRLLTHKQEAHLRLIVGKDN